MIKSGKLRWVGHVTRMEEGRSALKILPCELRKKRPLERPKHRLEDNFIMDLQKIYVNTRKWIKVELIGDPLSLRIP